MSPKQNWIFSSLKRSILANSLLISNYACNKLPSIFNNWFIFSSNFHMYETSFVIKSHLKAPSAKTTSYRKGAITSSDIKTWNDIQKITYDVLLNSFNLTKLKFFSVLKRSTQILFLLHHVFVTLIIYYKTLTIIQILLLLFFLPDFDFTKCIRKVTSESYNS